MQCHKCKWNEESIYEKQAHCLSCHFQDCHPIHIKGRAADGMPRQIPLDDVHADFILMNKLEPETNDVLEDLELEETQVQLIMDFVSAFSALPLRKRLTALALLEYGGDANTEICKATGLSRSCVVSHRNYFEADPFWSKLLKRATVFNQRKRKRPEHDNRGHAKGTKQRKSRKWKVPEGDEGEEAPNSQVCEGDRGVPGEVLGRQGGDTSLGGSFEKN